MGRRRPSPIRSRFLQTDKGAKSDDKRALSNKQKINWSIEFDWHVGTALTATQSRTVYLWNTENTIKLALPGSTRAATAAAAAVAGFCRQLTRGTPPGEWTVQQRLS